MQKIGTGLIVTLVSCTQFLSAMEFDFRPLSSLCRIEVNLTTDFGSGKVRGTFGQLAGNLNFYPENPAITEGKVLMRSGSLRFGHAKVANSTHTPEFLDSQRYPEISFQLESLSNYAWHDRELRALRIQPHAAVDACELPGIVRHGFARGGCVASPRQGGVPGVQ